MIVWRPQLGGFEWGVRVRRAGVDGPRVGLGEEDGQSSTIAGQLVAFDAGDPLDDPLAAQAPEAVGHLADAVARDRPGDQFAQ